MKEIKILKRLEKKLEFSYKTIDKLKFCYIIRINHSGGDESDKFIGR